MLTLASTVLSLAPSLPQCGPETLVASVARTTQAFGAQVAIDGQHLLVSAPTQEGLGLAGRGCVYSFRRDEVTGLQEVSQILTPSVSVEDMRFGASMDQQRGTLVIGAPAPAFAPGSSAGQGGMVFLFEYDGATNQWLETQALELLAPMRFGSTLRLFDDLLFIAEAYGNEGATGRIHEYRRSPTSGQYTAVQHFDGPTISIPGFASAFTVVDRDTLAVGDPFSDVAASQGGAVRIYNREAHTGVFVEGQTLVSPTPAASAMFGETIAGTGADIFIGDPRTQGWSQSNGVAHAYRRNFQGIFSLVQTIDSDLVLGGFFNTVPYFGHVLAAEGGQAIISSRAAVHPAVEDYPMLFRYEINPNTGQYELADTVPSAGYFLLESEGYFDSADIDGDTAIWGYPSVAILGDRPEGRAYALAGPNCGTLGTPYCAPAVPNSSGQPATLTASGTGSMSTGPFSLTAHQLPSEQLSMLIASQLAQVSSPANSAGKLCLGDSPIRFVNLIQLSDLSGSAQFLPDLGAIPGPNGPFAVSAGMTLHFQVWYRDLDPGATNNFTSALRIVFEP